METQCGSKRPPGSYDWSQAYACPAGLGSKRPETSPDPVSSSRVASVTSFGGYPVWDAYGNLSWADQQLYGSWAWNTRVDVYGGWISQVVQSTGGGFSARGSAHGQKALKKLHAQDQSLGFGQYTAQPASEVVSQRNVDLNVSKDDESEDNSRRSARRQTDETRQDDKALPTKRAESKKAASGTETTDLLLASGDVFHSEIQRIMETLVL